MKIFRNLCCLMLALSAPVAWAQEASGEELVEKVVVRNRLFNVAGRFELGANFGFSMLSKLTDHYNLNISAGYNFMDALALELRVGYAISSHTGLADDISEKFFAQSMVAIPNADDMSDLWEMKFNAMVGLRWQPIYGKLGLMAELPVHFQFYVWLGGGVAMLERTSVVICNQTGMVQDPNTGKNRLGCVNYLRDSKVGPLLSVAAGFRFFVTDNHVVRFEIRDYSWVDSYLTCSNRAAALTSNNPTGNVPTTLCPSGTVAHTALTNLVQFDLGYTFIF